MGGGGTMGQLSINSMALPPIMQFGSEKMKDKVLRDVITGKKNCSLMISEPTAGSEYVECFGLSGVEGGCSAPKD